MCACESTELAQSKARCGEIPVLIKMSRRNDEKAEGIRKTAHKGEGVVESAPWKFLLGLRLTVSSTAADEAHLDPTLWLAVFIVMILGIDHLLKV